MQPGTDRVTMMGSMVVVRREGREGGHEVRDREKRMRKKRTWKARGKHVLGQAHDEGESEGESN